ncbi:5'-nucleotidase domain-containing protein [Perkinsela sp. CCAP 1560/4]|nr:5'-nucleotidase domain-containing protein [Perkinsela sp. CCAP 1560/4]|eukprot:KNH09375.1 5'-nucleotidase domain-containing protein [Perkinsela sp. CCAP 1560/4]
MHTLPQKKRWVGFDLDHTLISYHLPPLLSMIDRGYRDYLTTVVPELHICSQQILSGETFINVPVDLGFFRRGVVLDFQTGDLLFLKTDGAISTAFHGRRLLTSSEIEAKYPCGVWTHHNELERGKPSANYFVFSEFFTLGVLFGSLLLIEIVDGAVCPQLTEYTAIEKFNLAFFQHSFDWRNFSSDSGNFFPHIKKDVKKYVKLRPDVLQMIANIRDRGIGVFLCTNSHFDYAHFLMNALVNSSEEKGAESPMKCELSDFGWIKHFDCTFVYARKPHFFHDLKNPTSSLNISRDLGTKVLSDAISSEKTADHDATGSEVFVGGNASYIENVTSGTPIYIGDHLLTDFAASHAIGWQGVAVIEDDQHCNIELGKHFPCLLSQASYWKDRVLRSSNYLLSDVLEIPSIDM